MTGGGGGCPHPGGPSRCPRHISRHCSPPPSGRLSPSRSRLRPGGCGDNGDILGAGPAPPRPPGVWGGCPRVSPAPWGPQSDRGVRAGGGTHRVPSQLLGGVTQLLQLGTEGGGPGGSPEVAPGGPQGVPKLPPGCPHVPVSPCPPGRAHVPRVPLCPQGAPRVSPGCPCGAPTSPCPWGVPMSPGCPHVPTPPGCPQGVPTLSPYPQGVPRGSLCPQGIFRVSPCPCVPTPPDCLHGAPTPPGCPHRPPSVPPVPPPPAA